MICPQAIVWGDIASWAGVSVALLAAIATFWAVIVALRSSGDAIALARELKESDRQEAEKIFRLKAKAFSAVVVDEFSLAYRHLNIAADALKISNADDRRRLMLSTFELSQIQTTSLMGLLEHIEVFGDPGGKLLARTTTSLAGLGQESARNYQLLKDGATISESLIPSISRKIELSILQIRRVAMVFYEFADIKPDHRFIPCLSSAEIEKFDSGKF